MNFEQAKNKFLQIIESKKSEMIDLGLEDEYLLIKNSFLSADEGNFWESIKPFSKLSEINKDLYNVFYLDNNFFKLLLDMRSIIN